MITSYTDACAVATTRRPLPAWPTWSEVDMEAWIEARRAWGKEVRERYLADLALVLGDA